MALPTSGQLSYSQINVELGNGSTSQASMLAMATAASKPTTNASVSNFYGYSAGDSITLSWGATTTVGYYTYRLVNHTGHTSPQIITINFTYNISYTSDTLYIWSSINSTSTWSLKATVLKGGGSGSFTVPSVDYNDIVRIRWWNDDSFYVTSDITTNGGTVTSGSGTVSGTAGWTL